MWAVLLMVWLGEEGVRDLRDRGRYMGCGHMVGMIWEGRRWGVSRRRGEEVAEWVWDVRGGAGRRLVVGDGGRCSGWVVDMCVYVMW